VGRLSDIRTRSIIITRKTWISGTVSYHNIRTTLKLSQVATTDSEDWNFRNCKILNDSKLYKTFMKVRMLPTFWVLSDSYCVVSNMHMCVKKCSLLKNLSYLSLLFTTKRILTLFTAQSKKKYIHDDMIYILCKFEWKVNNTYRCSECK